jgi:polyhydroxyalkanoate synthase
LPWWRSGWPAWNPQAPPAADLLAALAAAEPEALSAAVGRAARRRFADFLTGVERYRHHPFRRDVEDPPAVWTEGSTRLLAYGSPEGRPVLFVPSLVNRGYVLDLAEGRSLMRHLASLGLRCFLLEWGWPEGPERTFTLTDYIAGRLERALLAALAASPGRPAGMAVAGYCMGGLLATALARRRPREVAALVLMATPWDFHAGEGGPQARALAAAMAPLLPLFARWGDMPVDAIQLLFAALDPLLALRKFADFGRLDPASPRAAAFVALEDWLNDGVPLAASVAGEVIAGWYGANTPARGQWRIAGEPVDPGAVAVPSLHLIPSRDRIVPPASAAALAAAMPGAHRLDLPLGHIGMVVAGNAPAKAWAPLAEWVLAHD